MYNFDKKYSFIGTFLAIFFLIFSCFGANAQPYRLTTDFSFSAIPPAPDYSLTGSWSSLPFLKDVADSIPIGAKLADKQEGALVDVFFIHPTIFTYKPSNEYEWNADVHDQALNKMVDESTILNQASVFNGSCKIYAPRYRQAHYSAFTTTNPENKKKALDVAYEDVKAAFLYYLQNYNKDRPIIIAAHSQGTIHAGRLLKEFFDGTKLQEKLVEAYLIGIAIPRDYFQSIPLSTEASQTGGFVTWNTFHRGYYPDYYEDGLDKAVCINPLTWTDQGGWVDRRLNRGGVGLKFKFVEHPVGAEVVDNMLWVDKPHVPGRIFLHTKIWHKADYNLFWNNIRENVALRIESYFSRQSK